MTGKSTDKAIFKQLCHTLQVQTDVTIQDLRKAYYQMARQCHPDKNLENYNSATSRFILISNAYNALCDKLKCNNFNVQTSMNNYQDFK